MRNRWIYILVPVLLIILVGIWGVNALQLNGPPTNEVYTRQWQAKSGEFKHLRVQSGYEIAVQFTDSPDQQDHIMLEGEVTSAIRTNLQQTNLQNGILNIEMQLQRKPWQLRTPKLSPHVQHITVQLANPDSLDSADFHLTSAQTNLNHVQAQQITVQSVSGRIKAEHLNGDVALKTSSGDMILQQWEGSSLNVQSGSGDMKLGSIQGELTSSAGSGKLNVQQLHGSAHLQSESGDIIINQMTLTDQNENPSKHKSLQITTDSGDITLAHPPATSTGYDAQSESGTVTVPQHNINPKSEIQLRSTSGNIRIGS
ncbi:DUF4097 family beta strand repeat-containing protein [Paenibacillus sp. WLX1005]|uniref:DUF4097 family beta strand repeat-containing protein n=1 Tax=Paenibacillus sp. WLX1005 TaxID=3243766 RepID=UPI003983EF09